MNRVCKYCYAELKRRPTEDQKAWGKRLYCSRTCSGRSFGDKVRLPIPNDRSSSHKRARKLKLSGPCERCGNPRGLHVHHRDNNPFNNELDNLERICPSCHLKHHRPRAKCIICGGENAGYGYCAKHHYHFKRYGDPLKYADPKPHHEGKAIICTTTGQQFMSIGEAAAVLGIDRSCVSRALKKGKPSKGYHFRHEAQASAFASRLQK